MILHSSEAIDWARFRWPTSLLKGSHCSEVVVRTVLTFIWITSTGIFIDMAKCWVKIVVEIYK